MAHIEPFRTVKFTSWMDGMDGWDISYTTTTTRAPAVLIRNTNKTMKYKSMPQRTEASFGNPKALSESPSPPLSLLSPGLGAERLSFQMIYKYLDIGC